MSFKQYYRMVKEAAINDMKEVWRNNYNKVIITSLTIGLNSYFAGNIINKTNPTNTTFQQAQEIRRELNRPIQINYEHDISLDTAINDLKQQFYAKKEQKKLLEQLVNTQEYQQIVKEKERRERIVNNLQYASLIPLLIGFSTVGVKAREEKKSEQNKKTYS